MSLRMHLTQIRELAEPVCSAHGVELVQVVQATERGATILRVMIDREGSEKGPGHGVTLTDCQGVSRDLSSALDLHEGLVAGAYRLEVSSPGLSRPQVKLADYDRFAGRSVKLSTREPRPDGRGGTRRNYSGRLVGTISGESRSGGEEQLVQLEVDGELVAIPFAEIAKANVVHRF